MSWLVTGVNGFVGEHFFKFLRQQGEKVYGTVNNDNFNGLNTFFLDLKNVNSVKHILEKTRPSKIVLLAGLSSLRDSFKQPEKHMLINYLSTKKILDIIVELKIKCKVLIISSGMVYTPAFRFLKEIDNINQNSPYSEAKFRQEALMKKYPQIPIIVSRSFNHTGIGQRENFLIPRLVKMFAKSRTDVVNMDLNNTTSQRDFLDVKDVCRAYKILLEEGRSGQIYNVCSSKVYSVMDIIHILEQHTGKKALINCFKSKNERPFLAGDNSKLISETSWRPQISLRQTIINLYEYFSN
jgi:nucleoside-diphosphate-sugar epimerase